MKNLRNPEKVYGLNFSREEIANAVKNNRLLTLDLETSHLCNLKCIYCYNSSGKKLNSELNLAEIKDIITQAKECGAKNISIIGGGEPFLHPNIMEIVRFIFDAGLAQDIFTNGTFLPKETARELLTMKVQLVVKMNSLKPEVQDFLVGVNGTGEKINKTLEMLQEIGYNRDNLLGVESIICRQNIEEMPDMWRWARDRSIIPYFEMITFQGRAKLHHLNVTIQELQNLFNELLRIDEENYGYTWNPHPPIAALSCQRHFHNLVVTSNGYVLPCVGVDIRLGNTRHSSLKDILNNSPILKSLRNIDKNIEGSCKSCGFNNECYGCRGMAYHLTGNCFSSDPLCWFNENKIEILTDGTIKQNFVKI